MEQLKNDSRSGAGHLLWRGGVGGNCMSVTSSYWHWQGPSEDRSQKVPALLQNAAQLSAS